MKNINLEQATEEILAGFPTANHICLLGTDQSTLQYILCQLIAFAAQPDKRRIVIVMPQAKVLNEWLNFFEQLPKTGIFAAAQPSLLPAFSLWGMDRFVNPRPAQIQRLKGLGALLDWDTYQIILTTLEGLCQYTLTPHDLSKALLHVSPGQERDIDTFEGELIDLGYIKSEVVEEAGTYAVRGGILDLYSPNYHDPIRLEFFGDTVESIRTFDLASQRSVSNCDHITIFPTKELVLPRVNRAEDTQSLYNYLLEHKMPQHEREGIVSAFQEGLLFPGFHLFAPLFRQDAVPALRYLNQNDLLIFPQSRTACFAHYQESYEHWLRFFEQDTTEERPTFRPQAHFPSPEEIANLLGAQGVPKTLEFGAPQATADLRLVLKGPLQVKESATLKQTKGMERFDGWWNVLAAAHQDGKSIALLASHEEALERLHGLLSHRGVTPLKHAKLFDTLIKQEPLAPGFHTGFGSLAAHICLEKSKTLILPESELFSIQKKATQEASTKLKNYIDSFRDLVKGALVVHIDHGVCRYLGLTTLEVQGNKLDFLILEFAGTDKLYLPVDKLSVLQRYHSGHEGNSTPNLDRLRSQGWKTRKSKVRKAVKELAENLIQLEAKRRLAQGHAYSPPGDIYFQFESQFPYEETPDQAKAIQEVNQELSTPQPMDRLVCGDVGFGKTEVALRAAMRAAIDGYQVMVLVPTTVLCHQHYRTFSHRMIDFGIRVAQANRFVKPAEIRKILQDFSAGKVDVLIGTHRILSKDIKPKKLGMVIIDEEQRFGVGHKEKLKTLAAGCDILSMSATPIPRTLHMAMIGLKSISLIATPPKERLSIKTFVSEFDEALIKNAIEQELKRGGQVFFVHNRVEDIASIAAFLKDLIPHAEMRVAHGQMQAAQLEEVVISFLDQRFPILICTSIIESGIDMPNVNTLIVNQAERFGLAQLYQIRGRVGRSSQQAHAYFLTPRGKLLSHDAARRLEILTTHQDLGEGFHIASYDLEMRGAGNLIGPEQSGYVAEVGVELYTDMLDNAIREMRGQETREERDIEIKIEVSAHIPSTYVPAENQRLLLYKNLFSLNSDSELHELRKEMEDRFGPLPLPCARILKVAQLKALLRTIRAAAISEVNPKTFELRFHPLTEKQLSDIIEITSKRPDIYRTTPDYRVVIALTPDTGLDDGQLAKLSKLVNAVYPIAQAMEDAE